jgi:hypothetical protein
MKISTMGLAIVGLAISATVAAAEEYNITSSVTVDAESAAVWNVIGDFCDIDDWHPGIVNCVLEARGGAIHRQLTLGDGALVLEKLVASAPGVSYDYVIVDAPLPITGYSSTVSVSAGSPTTVTWVGNFNSDVPDMQGALQGLYDGGLAAVAAHFSQ